jgi:hypothetical protein
MNPLKKLKVRNKIYARPWGNHKDGYIRLIYAEGKYARQDRMVGKQLVGSCIISIETKDSYGKPIYDIEAYAKAKGFACLRG